MSNIARKIGTRVLVCPRLKLLDLQHLIQDDALAIIIPNYYSALSCKHLSRNLLNCSNIENYTHELFEGRKAVETYFGVDRVGIPFNSTYLKEDTDPAKLRYYQNAAAGRRFLIHLARPFSPPSEILKNDLDLIYPERTELSRFESQTMMLGIARIAKAESSHLGNNKPHFDALPEKYMAFDSQIAANVYLQMPNDGGDLEIWDQKPLPPTFQVPKDWENDLGPKTVIRPQVGDLILFNCRKPHSIRSFQGVERISIQIFMGFNRGKPIQLWN